MGWTRPPGPAASMSELLDKYSGSAFRFAYHLTGNIEESQDLVQEAFRKVLSRWDQFDAKQSLENWCFAILRHLYFDSLRHYENDRRVSIDSPVLVEDNETLYYADLLADEEEELLEIMERRESAAMVHRAIRRLRPEYKAVIALCDIQGLSYQDVAEVIGYPVGTVRSRLSRARENLKRILLSQNAGREPALGGGSHGLS